MRVTANFEQAALFCEGFLCAAPRLPFARSALKQLFLEAGFDADAYRALYADLAAFSKNEAVNHAIAHGMSEGRRFAFKSEPERIADSIAGAAIPRKYYRLFLWSLCRSLPHQHVFVLASRLGLAPLLIVGDSHSNLYFSARALKHDLLPIHLLCTGGSARGLSNPDSRSNYGVKITRFLSFFEKQLGRARILFKFGQVDVEFVFNFQRAQRNSRWFSAVDYERFVGESVSRYLDFLSAVDKRRRFVVASIFPPSLSDEFLVDGYLNEHIARLESGERPEDLKAKLRELEMPTLRARTLMHRQFNERLQIACEEQGFPFLDDFSPFLGWNGVLARRFNARTGGADHHLDRSPATEAVIGRMISRLAQRA